MSFLPIDIESETIQLDGQWYTREELARSIKGMLDGGNFAVAKPSHALEQLNVLLGSLRTLAVRVTPDLAESLNAAAAQQARPVGALVREAICNYLGVGATTEEPAIARPAEPQPGAAIPQGRRPTSPEIPASPPVLQPTDAASLSARVNELRPGAALQAAVAGVATGDSLPSVLVNMDAPSGDAKADAKKEDSAERRWFSGSIRP